MNYRKQKTEKEGADISDRIMMALEEDANKDMEREISERKKVIELLSQGKKFYDATLPTKSRMWLSSWHSSEKERRLALPALKGYWVFSF